MPEDETQAGEDLQRLREENATLAASLKAQQQAAWRAEALKQFALAEPFADLVSGDTQEGILAAAKALHEKVEGLTTAAIEKAKPDVQRAAAREAYGTGASGAGGRPIEPRNDLADIERKIMDNAPTTYAERQRYLNEGGEIMMRQALEKLAQMR